jgi:hypothetical protein
MLAGEKKEQEGKGKINSPFHPCTRTPEWNSLCWLLERKREEKERRKIALFKRERERERESFLDLSSILLIP